MGRGIALGRVAGVRIRADWSLLVIAGLILVSLATLVFPEAVTGTPWWLDWLLSAAATVLFFGSLLAHELAHSVVARRRGVTVEGITLWLFGGISQLRDEVASPGDTLRITVVGPSVSIALGLVFGAVALALIASGAAAIYVLVPLWLAGMNVLLGVFNLIPAFPLDGGRILQALLWRRSGDRVGATVRAARGGRSVGLVMIAVGFFLFLAYDPLSGLWVAFVGWFLMTAAGAEQNHIQMGTVLAGLRVRDIMSPDPVVVPGWLTVDGFLRDIAMGSRHSCFPVRDWGGAIVGMISLRRLAAVPPDRRLAVRVQDVAAPSALVPAASPDDAVTELAPRLRSSPEGRALVFDSGRLVGIVSPSDIARAIRIGQLTGGRRAA